MKIGATCGMAVMLAACASFAGDDASRRERVRAAHESAIASPNEDAKRDAFKAELPYLKDLDAYVVEGDILVPADQLGDYLDEVHDQRVRIGDAKATEATKRLAILLSPELKLNDWNGEADIWSPKLRAKISYAVDLASFGGPTAEYTTVKTNLGLAAKEWEDVCPTCDVHFIYEEAADTAPSFDRVLIIVKRYDSDGEFIAHAPFPHVLPEKRYIYVDPSYFRTDYDRVGIFRHELGHLLGYRHEQIDRLSGCYHTEDNRWEELTPYDPKSVMHYFCGGHGTKTLAITDVDRAAHRKVYKK